MAKPRIVPLGAVFGRLTVIRERLPGEAEVLCRCECGTERFISFKRLGHRTNSCGCLRLERPDTFTTRGITFRRQRLETMAPLTVRLASGCLEWGGRVDDKGYGRMGYRARHNVLAHRAFYMEQVGEIPPGLTLDHLCHNRNPACRGGNTCPHRRCVEVTHLEPVPAVVNEQRSHNTMKARTHCPHGHEYSEVNTAIYEGRRFCKACRSAYAKKRWQERESR